MILTAVLALALLSQAGAHMALQEPPARNVLWRMGFNNLPRHEDDDYLICQEKPGGRRCPPCGDSADTPPPHPHEGGGQWATGIIAREYTAGQEVDIHVNVTRSHGGSVEFKLCPHNAKSRPVSQRCLDKYPLEVVGSRSGRGSSDAKIRAPYDGKEQLYLKVRLPAGVTCNQCVLQMTNHAEQFKPQKIMFRNCADISISAAAPAKTNGAAGKPVPFNEFPSISSRSASSGFPSQQQHRFFQ